MPKLSDFLGVQNTISLKVGEGGVTLGDLSEIGPDGLLYSGQTTDYAVKPNKGDQTIAQASVIASFLGAYQRQQPVQGGDGSLFIPSPATTSPTGLKISRYSAAGALISSQTIDSTGNACNGIRLFKLSNDNLCAVWETIGAIALKFAILDQMLNVVVAATSIDAAQNGNNIIDAIPLLGGGFSVVWESNANPENLRFATYSNVGAVVLAATTVMTWTAAGSMLTVARLVQCVTSGNVAIAASYDFSGGTTSQGFDYRIVNPTTGANIKAQTVLLTGAPTAAIPEMCAFAGFFAIAWTDGSAQKCWVFNEAGTQQGSIYSASTTSSSPRRFKLITDATYFYLLWDDSGASAKKLTRLANTGGASASAISVDSSIYNWNIDAFYERGYIVYTAQAPSGASQPKYGTVTTGNMAIMTAATAFGTAPATTNGIYPAVIPTGDFSYVFCSDQANVTATVFYGAKYADVTIVGPAAATGAANAVIPVNVAPGAYLINTLKGSVSKTFNMTTGANIAGNEGVLFPNGVILKGF